MNDRRFVSILNEVAGSMARAPLEPGAGRTEADAVHVWAEFLRRCSEKGISVGDPRWRALEVHRAGGRPLFRLPPSGTPAAQAPDDFSVGLALLMSMLHPEDDSV